MLHCQAFMVAKCSYAFSFETEIPSTSTLELFDVNNCPDMVSLHEDTSCTSAGSGCPSTSNSISSLSDGCSSTNNICAYVNSNHISSVSCCKSMAKGDFVAEECNIVPKNSKNSDGLNVVVALKDHKVLKGLDPTVDTTKLCFSSTMKSNDVMIQNPSLKRETDSVFRSESKCDGNITLHESMDQFFRAKESNQFVDDFTDKEGSSSSLWGDPPVLDNSVMWDVLPTHKEDVDNNEWAEIHSKSSGELTSGIKNAVLWDKPPSLTKMEQEVNDISQDETKSHIEQLCSHRWLAVSCVGAGLQNLGNTCFVNATLQCLTYTPPLVNYLLAENNSASCRVNGLCLMCELGQHMMQCFQNSGGVIKPHLILQKLKVIAKHMRWGRQEDAHEFLRYMVDAMNKSCISGHQVSLDNSKETIVNKIFGGYLRSQVTCLQCKAESNTYDPFLDLSLDVKNVSSIVIALQKFVQPETLDIDNAYNCTKCQQKVCAQKRFTIHRLSNILTIQLKRYGVMGGKVTRHIAFPDKLDLRPYMSVHDADCLLYQLYGVLVHDGHSTNSGHYYCYIMTAKGDWYCMNDHMVRRSSLSQVLNAEAYILLYIKQPSLSSNAADSLGLSNSSLDGCSPIHRSTIIQNLGSIVKSDRVTPKERVTCRGGQQQGSCKGGQIGTKIKSVSKLQYSRTIQLKVKQLSKSQKYPMKAEKRSGQVPSKQSARSSLSKCNPSGNSEEAVADSNNLKSISEDDTEKEQVVYDRSKAKGLKVVTDRWKISDRCLMVADMSTTADKNQVVTDRPKISDKRHLVPKQLKVADRNVNGNSKLLETHTFFDDKFKSASKTVGDKSILTDDSIAADKDKITDKSDCVSENLIMNDNCLIISETTKISDNNQNIIASSKMVNQTIGDVVKLTSKTVVVREGASDDVLNGVNEQSDAATEMPSEKELLTSMIPAKHFDQLPRIVLKIKQGKVILNESVTLSLSSDKYLLRESYSGGKQQTLDKEKRCGTVKMAQRKAKRMRTKNPLNSAENAEKLLILNEEQVPKARHNSRQQELGETNPDISGGGIVCKPIFLGKRSQKSEICDRPVVAENGSVSQLLASGEVIAKSLDIYDFSAESDSESVPHEMPTRWSQKSVVFKNTAPMALLHSNDNELNATTIVPGLNIPLNKRGRAFCPQSHRRECISQPNQLQFRVLSKENLKILSTEEKIPKNTLGINVIPVCTSSGHSHTINTSLLGIQSKRASSSVTSKSANPNKATSFVCRRNSLPNECSVTELKPLEFAFHNQPDLAGLENLSKTYSNESDCHQPDIRSKKSGIRNHLPVIKSNQSDIRSNKLDIRDLQKTLSSSYSKRKLKCCDTSSLIDKGYNGALECHFDGCLAMPSLQPDYCNYISVETSSGNKCHLKRKMDSLSQGLVTDVNQTVERVARRKMIRMDHRTREKRRTRNKLEANTLKNTIPLSSGAIKERPSLKRKAKSKRLCNFEPLSVTEEECIQVEHGLVSPKSSSACSRNVPLSSIKLKIRKVSTEVDGTGIYEVIPTNTSSQQLVIVSGCVGHHSNSNSCPTYICSNYTTHNSLCTEVCASNSTNDHQFMNCNLETDVSRSVANSQVRQSRNIFQNLAEAAMHTREEFTRQTGLGWTKQNETSSAQVDADRKGLAFMNQLDFPTLNGFNWTDLLNYNEPDQTG